MNKQVLIEAIILLVLSLIGIVEAIRLILERNPHVAPDIVGPGIYVLLMSLALMATGILHLAGIHKKNQNILKKEGSKEKQLRMISMVGILAIYIFLIDIIGYLMATSGFFLAMFRIAGVKSWRFNVIMTLTCTAIYYFVFIECCNMIFPRGIFFR